MPETQANGIRIHHEIAGDPDAPVLMLSNSLGTRLEMWEPQMPLLTEHYRVLRYDSRGHGRSEVPEGPYTIELLADDALALLDALGIERAHFCGLSMGGMVGQVLGARHGPRLSSLTLCSTTSFMPEKGVWDERIRAVARGGTKQVVDGVIERWFTLPFRSKPRDEIERVREMILGTSAEGYAASCAAVRDMDLRGLLPEIEVPTLVVVGDEDPATPPEMARAIRDAISGAELRIIPEAAHLLNIEQASAFNDALLAFLGRVGQA